MKKPMLKLGKDINGELILYYRTHLGRIVIVARFGKGGCDAVC